MSVKSNSKFKIKRLKIISPFRYRNHGRLPGGENCTQLLINELQLMNILKTAVVGCTLAAREPAMVPVPEWRTNFCPVILNVSLVLLLSDTLMIPITIEIVCKVLNF